jgi:CRP-like cAMP-binding protein
LLDAQKVPRCAAARQIQGKRWLLRFDRGQRIHARDTKGTAWRIVSGSVRLDREEPNNEQSFANLAIRGDVIGAETLLFGKYSFTATALTACVLESWPEGRASPVGDSLLRTLAKAERRAAEVIALRCGQARPRPSPGHDARTSGRGASRPNRRPSNCKWSCRHGRTWPTSPR